MSYKILIRRKRLMASPALRLVTSHGTDSGTFRLDENPNNYNFVHPFKSRFLVVEVDEIPQDLLTSLSIYNIDFRIETPEQTQNANTPEPDFVALCNTNADLASSNVALRLEVEELQSKNKALNTKFITIHDQLLVLAKTLETN